MPHSMSKKTQKLKKKKVEIKWVWARRSSDFPPAQGFLEAGSQPSSGVPGLLVPTVVSHSTSHCGSLGEPHGHPASPPLLSTPSQGGRRSSDRCRPSCSWTLLFHPVKSFSGPQLLSTGGVKSACECPHWPSPVPGGPGALSRTDSPAEPGKRLSGCIWFAAGLTDSK